jgi:uncharacterized protein involved in response to NO
MNATTADPTRPRGGIPRGLSTTGPVLFSYGFRPFFLGGAVWACLAMALWIASLLTGWELAGDYGARAWHAHEMLFGFASAVLAGFLLTAVPNWTGRLPVSGLPLFYLFLLWVAGRVALLLPATIGAGTAAIIDSLFLPALLLICMREVIAGRKWSDLKVMAGLGALTLANLAFHFEAIVYGAPDYSQRLAVAAYVMMVVIIGGRILPSFTRNWLNRAGSTKFPVPYNRFDLAAIALSVPALALWVLVPEIQFTGIACLALAVLQTIRLARWRGWTTLAEPLVAILHLAYAFVPLGFAAIAATAFGLIDSISAMHVLTVGTIAAMMLAVMTRATRGHTGRELTASRLTCLSYAAVILCALVRPLTAVLPGQTELIYAASGILWLAAFVLYLGEYGPMLIARRKVSHRLT